MFYRLVMNIAILITTVATVFVAVQSQVNFDLTQLLATALAALN
jgi:hypothetical protein